MSKKIEISDYGCHSCANNTIECMKEFKDTCGISKHIAQEKLKLVERINEYAAKKANRDTSTIYGDAYADAMNQLVRYLSTLKSELEKEVNEN